MTLEQAQEPAGYQFRQRSGIGAGPQSSAPWCDWCAIDRETYERYQREPNKLVQVRPVYEANERPRDFLAWAVETFGPVAQSRSERLMRFVEEAIELAHAEGMAPETIFAIRKRVYGRPRGDTLKEIGQVQATLETFAENIGASADELAQAEFDRVQNIPRAEWECRHAAKQAIGIAETYRGPY